MFPLCFTRISLKSKYTVAGFSQRRSEICTFAAKSKRDFAFIYVFHGVEITFYVFVRIRSQTYCISCHVGKARRSVG